VSITAVGDTVNTASRLESLTKTYRCELVISETVVLRAGIDLGAAPRHEIEIRGRVERLVVRKFASARDLPVLEGRGKSARKSSDVKACALVLSGGESRSRSPLISRFPVIREFGC
jgi:hypothetical protein